MSEFNFTGDWMFQFYLLFKRLHLYFISILVVRTENVNNQRFTVFCIPPWIDSGPLAYCYPTLTTSTGRENTTLVWVLPSGSQHGGEKWSEISRFRLDVLWCFLFWQETCKCPHHKQSPPTSDHTDKKNKQTKKYILYFYVCISGQARKQVQHNKTTKQNGLCDESTYISYAGGKQTS